MSKDFVRVCSCDFVDRSFCAKETIHEITLNNTNEALARNQKFLQFVAGEHRAASANKTPKHL